MITKRSEPRFSFILLIFVCLVGLYSFNGHLKPHAGHKGVACISYKRILREFDAAMNKQFKNVIGALLPTKMIPVVIELSGIDPDKKVNGVSREERQHLVQLLKQLPLTVTGLRGWNEAIITKGGVSVKDVNPSTMESKLVSHLYFCGEVLDLDALTGGYNLQIAWSTGYLAGMSVETCD